MTIEEQNDELIDIDGLMKEELELEILILEECMSHYTFRDRDDEKELARLRTKLAMLK